MSQREYTVAWVWHDGPCPDCKRRKWRYRIYARRFEEPRIRPDWRWALYLGPLFVARWWR